MFHTLIRIAKITINVEHHYDTDVRLHMVDVYTDVAGERALVRTALFDIPDQLVELRREATRAGVNKLLVELEKRGIY